MSTIQLTLYEAAVVVVTAKEGSCGGLMHPRRTGSAFATRDADASNDSVSVFALPKAEHRARVMTLNTVFLLFWIVLQAPRHFDVALLLNNAHSILYI